MKIAIIGRFEAEGFGRHISDTFQNMGHSVVECDPTHGVSMGWWDRLPLPAKAKALRHHFVRELMGSTRYVRGLLRSLGNSLDDDSSDYDLILSTSDFLSPLALKELKREFSAKIVLWFPDHAARLGRAFMMCGQYDHMFFKDPFLVDRFRRELGWQQSHYLPECCRADLHSLGKDPGVEESIDLGTAGSLHPARYAALRPLVSEGYRITVWGPPLAKWMQDEMPLIETRPYVVNHEKVRAFRSCRIVLNTTYPAEVYGTNVRTFEAAGAGAFQLVNARQELGNLFKLDDELVTFSDLGELSEKIRYYLPRYDERRIIAERARKRALAEHTYEHRLNKLLELTYE